MTETDSFKNKTLEFAHKHEQIRAILLTGSRANPKATPDPYQDFDLLFVVDDIESFIKDKNWLSFIGKPLLQQLPDTMLLGNEDATKRDAFTYLTIFEDGTRVDLTLYPIEKIKSLILESLSVVWLDKDNLFDKLPPSSDSDYHIQKPSERELLEVCNEFWWTATYVAKGLAREEIIYAKDMMENVIRPMFLQMIAWKIGYENDFEVSIGKSGRFLKQYLSTELYENLLKTYSDSELEANWNALFLMMKIFKEIQIEVAEKLHFNTNLKEADNSIGYIMNMREDLRS